MTLDRGFCAFHWLAVRVIAMLVLYLLRALFVLNVLAFRPDVAAVLRNSPSRTCRGAHLWVRMPLFLCLSRPSAASCKSFSFVTVTALKTYSKVVWISLVLSSITPASDLISFSKATVLFFSFIFTMCLSGSNGTFGDFRCEVLPVLVHDSIVTSLPSWYALIVAHTGCIVVETNGELYWIMVATCASRIFSHAYFNIFQSFFFISLSELPLFLSLLEGFPAQLVPTSFALLNKLCIAPFCWSVRSSAGSDIAITRLSFPCTCHLLLSAQSGTLFRAVALRLIYMTGTTIGDTFSVVDCILLVENPSITSYFVGGLIMIPTIP